MSSTADDTAPAPALSDGPPLDAAQRLGLARFRLGPDAPPWLMETLAFARDEVARLTRERNALVDFAARADAADGDLIRRLFAEVGEYVDRVATLARERDEARAIIEGRGVPPTDAETVTHHAKGGSWLVASLYRHDMLDGMAATRRMRDALAEAGYAATWWALDSNGRPCAWPVTP